MIVRSHVKEETTGDGVDHIGVIRKSCARVSDACVRSCSQQKEPQMSFAHSFGWALLLVVKRLIWFRKCAVYTSDLIWAFNIFASNLKLLAFSFWRFLLSLF